MADNKAELVLDGDVSPLREALRAAAADLKRFGDDGKTSIEHMGSPLETLQKKFIAVGALLAGGKLFKDVISETVSWTKEALALSKSLGITTENASILNVALGDIYQTSDTMNTATAKITKTLNTQESAFIKLGVATRDQQGHLRSTMDIMADANAKLLEFKEGTDRNIEATKIYGKGWQEVTGMLKLTPAVLEDARKKAEELHLIVGPEGVAKTQAYRAAMNDVEDVGKSLTIQMGDALLPVLTRVGAFLGKEGPDMANVFKTVLQSVAWVAGSVWLTLKDMGDGIGALAAQAGAVMSGDFAMAKRIGQMRDEQSAKNKAAFDQWKIDAFQEMRFTPTADGPNKRSTGGNSDSGAATKKKSIDLDAMRVEDMGNAQQAADKELEILRRAAEKELEIRRKKADQALQIKFLQMDGERNAELDRIDEMEAQAAHEVKMGQSTQAEYLSRLEQFNQERLEAEIDLIEKKIEAAKADPTQNPVELERMQQALAEVRRKYAKIGADINREEAINAENIWRDLTNIVSGLWDRGIQALINGTLTWRNATQAIGAEMVKWFATQVVGPMVKDWIAGQIKKITAMLGFTATEKGMQVASTAATIATKTAETTVVVGANAAQAGSGAAASQASIPIVGPILALAAMAAVFAAVMSMGKKKSAMGGYDIPKGVNPMTQLHAEEMVLPKQYANAIRGMAKGGAGDGSEGGSLSPLVVNISSPDSRGVRDLLLNNPDALAEAIRKAHRNGFR